MPSFLPLRPVLDEHKYNKEKANMNHRSGTPERLRYRRSWVGADHMKGVSLHRPAWLHIWTIPCLSLTRTVNLGLFYREWDPLRQWLRWGPSAVRRARCSTALRTVIEWKSAASAVKRDPSPTSCQGTKWQKPGLCSHLIAAFTQQLQLILGDNIWYQPFY